MKQFTLFILLLTAFACCKKDDSDSHPLSGLESITGKWYAVERSTGQGKTEYVPTTDGGVIEVRFDGVLVDKNGYLLCCWPGSYKLNGIFFDIKPQASVKSNCELVDCVPCSNLTITQTSPDEIVTKCDSSMIRFLRVP